VDILLIQNVDRKISLLLLIAVVILLDVRAPNVILVCIFQVVIQIILKLFQLIILCVVEQANVVMSVVVVVVTCHVLENQSLVQPFVIVVIVIVVHLYRIAPVILRVVHALLWILSTESKPLEEYITKHYFVVEMIQTVLQTMLICMNLVIRGDVLIIHVIGTMYVLMVVYLVTI
jgi:hypothetical protein